MRLRFSLSALGWTIPPAREEISWSAALALILSFSWWTLGHHARGRETPLHLYKWRFITIISRSNLGRFYWAVILSSWFSAPGSISSSLICPGLTLTQKKIRMTESEEIWFLTQHCFWLVSASLPSSNREHLEGVPRQTDNDNTESDSDGSHYQEICDCGPAHHREYWGKRNYHPQLLLRNNSNQYS